MFKRSKSKPSLRTRAASPDDADTEVATSDMTIPGSDTASIPDTREESPISAVKKFKDRTKKSRPKSRLSFGAAEEEEDSGGEVFQVKKSKLSRNLTLGKHPANIPDNLDQATISLTNRSGPTYDEASLKELKRSTNSSRAPPPTSDPYDADMSMDISMDLGDVSTLDMIDTGDGQQETFVHTESSIKQAKERRERLRKSTVAGSGPEDYISLSVTRKSEDQGPHPESRLVREEDELGEGDDEYAEYTSAQERIALGKKSRKVEASKRREMMSEMISEAVDDDEESTEWEQEQLRRGGHIKLDSSTPKVKQTYKPTPIPPVAPIPTLGPALARLTQQLSQLTTSHASNTAALNTIAQEREQVDAREKELRVLVEKTEEKRAWFSSFSDWVESVAAFLDEKYPLLEKLEDEHVSLLEERHGMISKRRLQDMEDDLSTFLGPLPIVTEEGSSTNEIDEFGRAIPKPDPVILKRERQRDHAARYQQYQERGSAKVDEDGYWTDANLPLPDETAYQTALASVATRTHDILSDVKSKEFLDPAKGRWKSWREQYEDSYVSAFGGLGVVSAWEFWVRLECVGWDCIEEPKSLDQFRWYHGLYEFCRRGDPNDEGRELGPEGDLVSSMVSTAIIPRLAKLMECGALDVYSSKHIRRAVDLAEEIEASVLDVDQGKLKLQLFLRSVITCFSKAVSETESLLAKFTSTASSRSAPGFDPEAIPARKRYLARQVKLMTNLLRWRKHTGEAFGAGQLVTKIVDGCILEVVDSGWDVGGKEALERVAALLPQELVTVGVRTRLNRR